MTADALLADHRRYLEQYRERRARTPEGHHFTPPRVSLIEAARARLLADARWLGRQWITTELVGATRRARRRHELEQQQAAARRTDEAAELEAIAELPDDTLAWLLSVGWTAEQHRPGRRP